MSLAQRVLASTSRAVVLLGPAASGKTAAALELYKHFDQSRSRSCLLIAPNFRGVTELKQRLLTLDGQPHAVVVSPNVTTFAVLAADILAAGGEGKTPASLSAFARRLLLRSTIDQLCAAGRLPALAAVADTPGLAICLDRAISELKRAAVEPDALAGAIGRSRSKASDLLVVYRSYQEQLTAQGRYDTEGRMWLARDLLAAGRGLPAGIDAIIADGFTDFTPTQLDMLGLLAAAGRRVVITLPWADDGRARMWHWTRRTLNNLRAALGKGLEEIIVPCERVDSEPEMADLWGRVFNFDAGSCPAPPGLSLIAAAGIDAEVSAVARRVKRLLMDGAEAGSIAVIMRSTDTYRQVIDRIFAECEIPLAPAPRALTDVPIVRFALDAASLGPDFAFRNVTRVITNSYFSPKALGEFDSRTVSTALALMRRGNVLCGRGAYSAAATKLAESDARKAEAGDDQPNFAAAAQMLEKLFDLSQKDIGHVAAALDLRRGARSHAESELAARDLRALATLEVALAQLGDAKFSRVVLADALSVVTCPSARGESLVDVMDVLDARALRRKHVFLLGLGQGQFPRRQSEGSMISEANRTQWPDRGVILDSRTDLDAREMLLFYLAVSRSDGTLTVSYPSSDAGGSHSAPSNFLEALTAPVGGLGEMTREEILPGQFVPTADQVASNCDAMNAALAALFDRDGQDASGSMAWIFSHKPTALRQAAMGIWAHTRRWRQGPCDAFDGRISEPSLQAALAQRFGREHVFSAGQLETFAQCPWRFFAQYVLGLPTLGEPQRTLEAVARGIFCHDVLCDVYRRLRGEGQSVDLTGLDQSDVMTALDDAIDVEADNVWRKNPAYPMLWQLQKQQMSEQLRRYMIWQYGIGQEAESLHFELSFGMADSAESYGNDDEIGIAEPVEIETPARSVKLRGRIDRVDLLRECLCDKLLIVDYKTGRLPVKQDFDSGRSLQAPLYAAAVEKILNRPCAGGAFHRIGPSSAKSEQYFAAVKRKGGNLAEDSSYDARREFAMTRTGQFVEAMSAGLFDVAPCGKCPSYCAYRRICGYSEARARFKALGDNDQQEGPASE